MGTKTAKFNLNQYSGTDTPKWLQGYNEDMAQIEAEALNKKDYDPTNVGADVFRASNHKMTGYSKQSEYSTIDKSDSTSLAIGKLEAGVIASGDMQKATYDTDNDGKVDQAEVADKANSVDWASVQGRPNTLPNPNALTIQMNGSSAATYTGSEAKSVNITANAVGAASLVGGKVPAEQLPIIVASDIQQSAIAGAEDVDEALAALIEQLQVKVNLPEYGTWTPIIQDENGNIPTQSGSGSWRILDKIANLTGRITITENNMNAAIRIPLPFTISTSRPYYILGHTRFSFINMSEGFTQLNVARQSAVQLAFVKSGPSGLGTSRVVGTELTNTSVLYFDVDVELP